MVAPPDTKVAIVIGGTPGIGLGIAHRLAADGARVAPFDLNAIAAQGEATKMRADGLDTIGVAVSVSDRSSVDLAVVEVHDDTAQSACWSTTPESRAAPPSSRSRRRRGTGSFR
jgi:NAD(P)-dependent dehydrogenase (short-subunit alcohol dehydrogenase family)